MGFFQQISLKELITMMSDQDRKLLVTLEPDLMSRITIDGSDLLARLTAKGALTEQQRDHIKVTEQYYICHLLVLFFV